MAVHQREDEIANNLLKKKIVLDLFVYRILQNAFSILRKFSRKLSKKNFGFFRPYHLQVFPVGHILNFSLKPFTGAHFGALVFSSRFLDSTIIR